MKSIKLIQPINLEYIRAELQRLGINEAFQDEYRGGSIDEQLQEIAEVLKIKISVRRALNCFQRWGSVSECIYNGQQ